MAASPRRQLEVLPDAEAVARRAAAVIAEEARSAVARRGRFFLALSGGRTPWRMLEALAEEEVPWQRVAIYQVDERVAPRGHPDRNLTQLERVLPPPARERLIPMPVEASDLEAACALYGASLPQRFDLVHLGLGEDGHTASLVPGDPVLEARDRPVAVTGEYKGRRRMTLTYPVLDRAELVLWVVTGEDKRNPLALLMAGDPSIPAGRVAAPRQLVVADRAAAA
ncbi:MAG: 6-phosphogluconolactonase [Thermoleophilia bacterium]